MTSIHYLSGLPRAGSTLLANILGQHPDVYVTGTSPLFGAVNAVADAVSSIPEVVAELENIPGTYDRYLDALRSFMQSWHANRPESVVIDKHRGWPHRFALLQQLDPDAVMVAAVRDPRSVIASLERQERRTGLFNSPVAPTLYAYADQVLSPPGMVGQPLRLMEDMIRRKIPMQWVRYETLLHNPHDILERLTEALGLEPFDYDIRNVENTATDLDAIHLHKFPHQGSGPVCPSRDRGWEDVMSDEVAALVAGVSPLFMQMFAYN